MYRQRTIAEKITCTGMGLHSGQPVQLSLFPAQADSGIVFVRRREGAAVEIPAQLENVASTANAMTLERDGVSVSTVEHLLAALRSLGVDNARIELDGPEVPVMDGSSASFAYLTEFSGGMTSSDRPWTISM